MRRAINSRYEVHRSYQRVCAPVSTATAKSTLLMFTLYIKEQICWCPDKETQLMLSCLKLKVFCVGTGVIIPVEVMLFQ